EVLTTLAARIQGAVRAGDTVARLGGDEFAVLVEGSRRSLDDARAAAERVLAALDAPVPVADRQVSLSGSIGIDVAAGADGASALLRQPDIARYRAKSAGKGRYVVYEPSMRALVVERLELEADLALAVERDQMHLVYQPFVAL